MFGKVTGSCVLGIEGQLIEVEVDIANGLPMFAIVGLPDSAVRESADRVRAAIKNCGFTFPPERITVNLAPADVRKEGSSFDLAIALGLLVTSGQVAADRLKDTLVIGELALDGTLRAVPGVLPMVHRARLAGLRRVVLPLANVPEARLIEGIAVDGMRHLQQIRENCAIFNETNDLRAAVDDESAEGASTHGPDNILDYVDVCGQLHAKRALMIAAAGMHNILLIGPPGTGKTMLVRRLPTILPPMHDYESLEVTKIYSVAGKLAGGTRLIRERPFRSPHHTVSAAGLIGGGPVPKPGEVSLAHRGVLFLDELPEFTRPTLEVLRQPLEDRSVTIGRARGVFTFPAHVMLAASMNPCPCGYYGAETASNSCTCSPLKRLQYRARISGPLLDRIDLHVEVPRVDYAELHGAESQLSSIDMYRQVAAAHRLQLDRYGATAIRFNAELNGRMLRTHCRLGADAEVLLMRAFDAIGLSIRAHDRILKIARTIADLEESAAIEVPHVAEAIQYRQLDRK